MKQQNKFIAIVILTVLSVTLTLFAPLAKETTRGLFSTYSDTVFLFSGVQSTGCVIVTVIAGICMVLFSLICLKRKTTGKAIIGARLSGLVLLAMQVLCTVQALSYYDYSSMFGAIRSEVSEMSVHPLAIVTVIITFVTVIMCFKAKSSSPEQ